MSLDNQKMPNWVLQHRIFCVEHYFRTSSYESVKTQFRTSFQTEVAPDKSLIYRWVEKFRKHGTVQNLNSKSDDRQTHSGRPKKRTTEVIGMVRNSNSAQNGQSGGGVNHCHWTEKSLQAQSEGS